MLNLQFNDFGFVATQNLLNDGGLETRMYSKRLVTHKLLVLMTGTVREIVNDALLLRIKY